MVQRFRLTRHAFAFAFTAAFISTAALTGPTATAQYTCFPTCAESDAKMLSLAGTGANAFSGNDIMIGIGAPGDATSLSIEIFDGESAGAWDRTPSAPLEYAIYMDPTGNGTTANSTLASVSNAATALTQPLDGSTMTNNGWYVVDVATTSGALSAATGNYVYFMRVSMPTAAGGPSSFKIRVKSNSAEVVTASITIRSHQSFSIQAPLTLADVSITYPNFISTSNADTTQYSPTLYDGIWNLFFDVPEASRKLAIWDGDMDHGTDPLLQPDASLRAVDNDDPDTPNDFVDPVDNLTKAFIPAFATSLTTVNAEGGTSTINPFDDNRAPYNRRSPAIRYDVYFPDETTFVSNNNPSGGLEWEQFMITTDATQVPAAADVSATAIPAGIYRVRLEGMDLNNVNAWRFFNDVVATPGTSNVEVIGVDAAGDPVSPLRAVQFVMGEITGKVFYDANSDGDDNDGDSDHDIDNNQVSSGDSDSDGGNDSDNDDAGDSDNDSTNDNDSEHDSDSEGDSDNDVNGDSDNCTTNDRDSDGSATTEIGGEQGAATVVVTLTSINSDGTLGISTATMTNTAGEYKFTNVAVGNYRVTVDSTSLSNEAVPVTDPDGITTRHYAATTVDANSLTPRLVFGYKLVAPTSCKTAKYWMDNNTSWPCESVTIGAKTYSKEDAIKIMKKPTKVDKTMEMTTELICAKLNRASGVYSDHMTNCINDADTWLSQNEAGKGKNTTAKQKQRGEHNGYSWSTSLQDKCSRLSDFNRGRCTGDVD